MSNKKKIVKDKKSNISIKSLLMIAISGLKKISLKSIANTFKSISNELSELKDDFKKATDELIDEALDALTIKPEDIVEEHEVDFEDIPPIPVDGRWNQSHYLVSSESYNDIQNFYKEFGYPKDKKEEQIPSPIQEGIVIDNSNEIEFADEIKEDTNKEVVETKTSFLTQDELYSLINNYNLTSETKVEVEEKPKTL